MSAAVAYARSHGGGTIAVSSQQGAAAAIIGSGADVAGIGGFSGRESEVTVTWLADMVRAGTIRWVLAGDGGGGFRDGRTGAATAIAAVAQTCTPGSAASSSTTTGAASGLYDCAGKADALASAAAS